jgi:HAD superfamily hydrolase (TIGR01509 family)
MADGVELVIFDCDGVLVDSERLVVKVEAAVLGELGWPLTEAEVSERFMGRSPEFMRSEVQARLGDTLPAGWEARFGPLYRQVFESDLTPVDGVPEALEQIELPSCVASSSNHEWLQLVLGLTGLYERFEGRIFSASEVAQGKPAPDLFLHAAEQMGSTPARCVVVEDSRYGVHAARAANMRVLAFAGGLTPPEFLEGPSTILFDHMRELPKLLELMAVSG